MSVSSMTGFARIEGADARYSWTWEVKSVNARGLDMRFRLPSGFDQVEAAARKLASEKFSRGNLSINLTLRRPDAAPKYQVNRDVLDQMKALMAEHGDGESAPQDIATLLTVRGVVDVVEDEEDDAETKRRNAVIADGFSELADGLSQARLEEGARLKEITLDHLGEIDRLTADAAGLAALQPEKRQEALRAQIADLLSDETPVAEDRLAQEIALIVARGDVREELDRLIAHVASARELIEGGGAIGRRLDFLCQEFNREANTLCSKSSDLELTRIGLDLKAAIERLREQVQNIE